MGIDAAIFTMFLELRLFQFQSSDLPSNAEIRTVVAARYQMHLNMAPRCARAASTFITNQQTANK